MHATCAYWSEFVTDYKMVVPNGNVYGESHPIHPHDPSWWDVVLWSGRPLNSHYNFGSVTHYFTSNLTTGISSWKYYLWSHYQFMSAGNTYFVLCLWKSHYLVD